MTVVEGVPIEQDMLRLRNEFIEMPGLTVTITQTARLFGVRLAHAADMLALLEREGFLTRDECGSYRRPSQR